jgi:hypothetical protein
MPDLVSDWVPGSAADSVIDLIPDLVPAVASNPVIDSAFASGIGPD